MGTTKHTRRISLLCRAPLHRLINRGVRKSLVPIASVARAPERTNGSRLGAISLRRKIKNLPQKKLAFHKLVSKIVQEKTTEAPPDAFPPPGTTPGEDPFSTVCLAASRLGLAVPDPVATDPTPMADCAEILVDQGDLCGVLDDEVARLRLEREVHGLANADRLRALASRMGEARGALLGTRLGSVALCRRLKGAPAGRAAVPVEVEQQGAFLALLDVMRWEAERVSTLTMDWRWLEAHSGWSSTLWRDNLGSILGASQAISEKITDGEALVSAFDGLLNLHHAKGPQRECTGAHMSCENSMIASGKLGRKGKQDGRK